MQHSITLLLGQIALTQPGGEKQMEVKSYSSTKRKPDGMAYGCSCDSHAGLSVHDEDASGTDKEFMLIYQFQLIFLLLHRDHLAPSAFEPQK